MDAGGGGTVAMYMANRNITTLDAGVPVLSMHAPFETVSKLDCYETYKGMRAVYRGGRRETGVARAAGAPAFCRGACCVPAFCSYRQWKAGEDSPFSSKEFPRIWLHRGGNMVRCFV